MNELIEGTVYRKDFPNGRVAFIVPRIYNTQLTVANPGTPWREVYDDAW